MYIHLAALSKANLKRKHAMRHCDCTLYSDAAGRQGEGGCGRADHTDGHRCWHLQVASQEGPHLQVNFYSVRQLAEAENLRCGRGPCLLMPWRGPACACQELLGSGCCRVDGQTWDLIRPLEGDCQLELLDFEHPLGKDVRAAVLPLPAFTCCAAVMCRPLVVTPAPCSTVTPAATVIISSCWAGIWSSVAIAAEHGGRCWPCC
jgi:hypothetical protein